VQSLVPEAPLCFMPMRFARKIDAAGRTTDFDAFYREIIAPAVLAVGLSRSGPTRTRITEEQLLLFARRARRALTMLIQGSCAFLRSCLRERAPSF
jgi:hypothetical protein